MSRTKMKSIDQHATGMRRAIWIGLSLLLIAVPAQASRIVQIRVGNHPTFTRLVFEMDAFAGYQVERRAGTDGTEQLIVTLEASTPSREINSKSVGIESVRIAEGADQAIAQIRLRKSGLQMKEMILSNPPRIVLDFVHSAAAVAEMTGDPYAKPTPVEPKPVVAKVVEPKPEPKPVVAKVVEPKPEPKPKRKRGSPRHKRRPKPDTAEGVEKPAPSSEETEMIDSEQGSGEGESSTAPDADRRAAQRASIPGVHKRGGLELPTDPMADPPSDQIADAAGAGSAAPLGSSKRVAKPSTDQTKRQAPSPSDVTRRIEEPKSADSGLPFNTVTLVGIAVGALIVLVVAVRIFRRRSLPNDLDVTAFADAPDDDTAELDRGTSDQIPAEEVSMNDSPTDDASAPQVEEQNTAAYSLSEVAATATEPETGLYNEDSEGEKPMDMDTSNLPTEREDFSASPAAVMSGGDSNMSQLVQELAGRIANLETRLDEANDSRERLERQVAAQSEELRVQRAAIARTQRALRSLSRSEEDQATEPALREPSQPAG
ncbi:MAG: hypothetical protein IH885_04850 [Myxococcales bacterium]|nr:hypothetical protein [Myxococcales bacterium]